MKCKNCQTEHENKFCPECGLKADATQTPKDKAMEMLESIDARTKKLEDAQAAKEKKIEERKKEREKRRETGKRTNRGILDIF